MWKSSDTISKQMNAGRFSKGSRQALALILGLSAFLLLTSLADAHRSGCHRWHSCPSDRGTYVCGDTGHCNYCPDNQYCKGGRPRAAAAPQERTTKSVSPQPVAAGVLTGRVVQVADGDTITVLDANKNQHRIRLQGIDAPERAQPFSNVSRQHLAELVAGKTVKVMWSKRDRYGRIVGTVFVDGRDVSLEQVKAGLAWHYKYYANEQSPEDRQRYAQAEDNARADNLGLWQEKNPVPPWEFRRRRQ